MKLPHSLGQCSTTHMLPASWRRLARSRRPLSMHAINDGHDLSARRRGPVEKGCSLADYYRMSSEHISVDTVALRQAAGGNAEAAAALDDYHRQCEQWLGKVEGEIVDGYGVVAAPVGAALRDFHDGLNVQVAAASAARGAVAANLAASAHRYDTTDADGAARVNTAGEAL